MKRTYPVLFTETTDNVLVEVPDLKILTEGEDIENAIDMARDAISISIISRENNNEIIPTASKISELDVKSGTFYNEGNTFSSIVDVNVEEYRKKIETRPVRRNVSLPSWLNDAAEKSGVNVSGILQEALMKKLDLVNKYQS
ncbi:MAG: type II toxin-antitoxin system HicB family antitoxin [Lachnospiraceae bacterium]|nr:type II toxin-antitoxin system HicB family antitoxin [Lachnospiraceae bacterium]